MNPSQTENVETFSSSVDLFKLIQNNWSPRIGHGYIGNFYIRITREKNLLKLNWSNKRVLLFKKFENLLKQDILSYFIKIFRTWIWHHRADLIRCSDEQCGSWAPCWWFRIKCILHGLRFTIQVKNFVFRKRAAIASVCVINNEK